MKKLIVAVFLAVPSFAQAEDLVTATLLDHVSVVTQLRSGQTKLALMDSVVQIGSKNGKSIFDLQAGFNGDVKPEPSQVASANFVAGGFLKVNTLLSDHVHYPVEWKFLNSLEHGPYVSFDFRRNAWYGGYQLGLAFSLQPK